MSKENGFDYDYIVIGSGFGGSVSALRLSEKGYKVVVLEKGKRWQKEDFPKTNWNTRKYMWLPQLGCYGYQMLTQLKHVFIFHGGGVVGGSLVYANQLLVPPDEVFARPEWGIDDCKETMMPHYQEAKRMLGRTPGSIRAVRPGARLGDIGWAIQSHAEANGYTVVRDYCGHGIGYEFHEDPQVLHYGRPGTGMALEPGMTFTIEPMINAGKRHTKVLKDGWTVVTKDHSLSAQWEHTVLVTETGYQVLTLRSGETI